MPEITDWLAYQKKAADERAKHVHEQRSAVIPRVQEITHKAQTVVDHPGWQWYADSLATKIAEVQTRRDATAHRMVVGTEMGKDLELLKINLNSMDAEIAGLKYAANLIPETVLLGQKIATGVNGSAAGISADR